MSVRALPDRQMAAPSPAPAEAANRDIRRFRSTGRPLDHGVRRFMERQLAPVSGVVGRYDDGASPAYSPAGAEAAADQAASAALGPAARAGGTFHDFSSVRVHTNSDAAAAAQARSAAAFAVGNHILFADGCYSPETQGGAHLLAHELTHLLQQGRDGRQSFDCSDRETHERMLRLAMTGDKSFSAAEGSAAYLGSWIMDMNQVFVPIVVDLVGPNVIFALMSYLAARKFGREITPEQFAFYRPVHHGDNPAGLTKRDLVQKQPEVSSPLTPADSERLGQAVETGTGGTAQDDVSPSATVLGENIFAVDQTGVMAFMRRTNLLVEDWLERAVEAGRGPEGLMLFGAAMHPVEDFFAHSNFIEIALDKLLHSESAEKLLPELKDKGDRRLFTYSAQASVRPDKNQPAEDRPVLTAGSFTTEDTKISILSEVVGLMEEPLPEPKTNAEIRAEAGFVGAFINSVQSRIEQDPELLAELPPGVAAVDKVSLGDIYEIKEALIPRVPDWIRRPVQGAIRKFVSKRVLQPLARQLQSSIIEPKVAETNLIQVMRDAQKTQQGEFSKAQEDMMAGRERLKGESVANQKAEAISLASERVTNIQATPAHVVAGPSHSQIAKDHPNSPFYGLSFALAVEADRRLRDLLLRAWEERHGAPTKPFDFGAGHFPAAAPKDSGKAETKTYERAQQLFESGRERREKKEESALQEGKAIGEAGGAPGQPHSLEKMRVQAAQRVRSVAEVLAKGADAPKAAERAIARLGQALEDISPEAEAAIAAQLSQARLALQEAGADQPFQDFRAIAADLYQTADEIGTARRHAQREKAHLNLVAKRDALFEALGKDKRLSIKGSAALLVILNREIQETAVAYTSEQRAVLEGAMLLDGVPTGLMVRTVKLPDLKGSPATVALQEEARRIMGHPYSNEWWKDTIRDFAKAHGEQLVNDIEARNEGVALYRGGHGR